MEIFNLCQRIRRKITLKFNTRASSLHRMFQRCLTWSFKNDKNHELCSSRVHNFAYPPQPPPLSCLPTYTPSVWSYVSLQSFFEWGLGEGVRSMYSSNQVYRAVFSLVIGLPDFSLLIPDHHLLHSLYSRPISTATRMMLLRNKTDHVTFLLKNYHWLLSSGFPDCHRRLPWSDSITHLISLIFYPPP